MDDVRDRRQGFICKPMVGANVATLYIDYWPCQPTQSQRVLGHVSVQ